MWKSGQGTGEGRGPHEDVLKCTPSVKRHPPPPVQPACHAGKQRSHCLPPPAPPASCALPAPGSRCRTCGRDAIEADKGVEAGGGPRQDPPKAKGEKPTGAKLAHPGKGEGKGSAGKSRRGWVCPGEQPPSAALDGLSPGCSAHTHTVPPPAALSATQPRHQAWQPLQQQQRKSQRQAPIHPPSTRTATCHTWALTGPPASGLPACGSGNPPRTRSSS